MLRGRRRPSPRSSSSRSSAPTASSSRPTATCRACARSATAHGILLIADEVMAGFGRTGRWFAVDHWDVVPDLITMAKGLTSAYLPLGAVGMRRHIADALPRQGLLRRPDLQLAPDGLRRGAGHDRGLRGGRADRARARDGRGDGAPSRETSQRATRPWARPATSACSASSSWSATARPYEPMAPYNGTSDEMGASPGSSARTASTRSCAGTRSSPTRR